MKKNFREIPGSPYAVFLASTAAIFLGFLFIRMFAVNAVQWDEYGLVDMVVNNDTSLEMLFVQNNEHRMFFPRLAYNAIAQATGMNSVAVMYFSFFLVTAAYLLLMFHLFKINKTPLNVLYPFLLGLILFNPIQDENILWGFQVGFYMTHVFSVFSVFFAALQMRAIGKNASRLAYFIISVVTAVVASFSSSQGLMSWIVIALLWLIAFRRQVLKSLYFYIWVLFGLMVFILYFHNYVKPGHHPLAYIFAHPLQTAVYLLHLFGCGLYIGKVITALLGGVILAVSVMILVDFWRSKELKDAFPVGLVLYGGLVCSLICIGRAWLYAQSLHFASRYTTFELIILIGIIIYLVSWKQRACSKYARAVSVYRVFAVTLAVIVVFLLLSAIRGIGGVAKSDFRQENKFIIQTYDQQPDMKVTRTFPGAVLARKWLNLLRTWGYGVFLEKTDINPDIFKNHSNRLSGDWISFNNKDIITFVNDSDDPYIIIAGWALNPAAQAPLEAMYVSLNDVFYPVFYGKSRSDMRFSFFNRAAYFTGFERAIPLSVLKDGQYSIKVYGLCQDRHYYKIEPEVTLRVYEGSVEIQTSDSRLP